MPRSKDKGPSRLTVVVVVLEGSRSDRGVECGTFLFLQFPERETWTNRWSAGRLTGQNKNPIWEFAVLFWISSKERHYKEAPCLGVFGFGGDFGESPRSLFILLQLPVFLSHISQKLFLTSWPQRCR